MEFLDGIERVPLSRFKRELNSLIKKGKTIYVTLNGEEVWVMVPEGAEEFAFMRTVL